MQKQSFQESRVLINPGVSIPEEATSVHHITNGMVQACMVFEKVARAILIFVSGCDLAGYNIRRLSVPLLT